MKARFLLNFITQKLGGADKAAVETAAEQASTGDFKGGGASLNAYLKTLPWRRRWAVVVPYSFWETTVTKPIMVLCGLLATVLLVAQLLFDFFVLALS